MALLSITEFSTLGSHNLAVQNKGDTPQAAQVPPITTQQVSFAGSTASATFNNLTNLVRLCSDTNCAIAWGVSPTATTASTRLPANVVEYYSLGSNGLQVAVITTPT